MNAPLQQPYYLPHSAPSGLTPGRYPPPPRNLELERLCLAAEWALYRSTLVARLDPEC